MSMDAFWRYFHEIFEALPRQGPGDRESTERALRLLPPLQQRHRILDIGCGSGTQTLDLARGTGARIVAVDRHAPFLEQLARRAAEQGFGDRIEPLVGDMNDLPFPDGSFDAVWSEGAIFIVGFAQGLASWRRLIAPGGHLVVSESCWLRPDPPAEVRELFGGESADLGDVAARRSAIDAAGYRIIGEFALPASGWWENYYVPLSKVLERFRAAHAGEPEALKVADRSQHEIDLYLKHPQHFGYVFFVLQPTDEGPRR